MKRLIEWFARNGVAANLVMLIVVLAGLGSLQGRMRFEVFPTIKSDKIRIVMNYRGATPAEVEEGVVIRIEEAIQDLEGIEEIISTASEGLGQVIVDAERGYDTRKLLDDLKNRIDAINTFPEQTEKPTLDEDQWEGHWLVEEDPLKNWHWHRRAPW
ncbi:MAG: efflux RND transporter permease subunit [Verrucomicrobiota bacterium]